MPTTISGTEGVDQIKDGTIQAADFATGVGPVFTKEYVSPEQTITPAGALTLVHGLGVAPKLTQCVFVCKTAEGGYSVDDVVDYMTSDYFATGGPGSTGFSVVRGAANIELRYSSNASVFLLLHKTTGAVFTPTLANWRLIVRAWA